MQHRSSRQLHSRTRRDSINQASTEPGVIQLLVSLKRLNPSVTYYTQDSTKTLHQPNDHGRATQDVPICSVPRCVRYRRETRSVVGRGRRLGAARTSRRSFQRQRRNQRPAARQPTSLPSRTPPTNEASSGLRETRRCSLLQLKVRSRRANCLIRWRLSAESPEVRPPGEEESKSTQGRNQEQPASSSNYDRRPCSSLRETTGQVSSDLGPRHSHSA